MQVRICPKCKAENKVDSALCSKCYASLDAALLSEAADPVAPVAQDSADAGQQVAAPTEITPPPKIDSSPGMPKAPAVGAQAPPASPPSMAGPSPYGPQPGTAHTPSFRETARPVKHGSPLAGILFVILLLGGGGFAAWWFILKPPTPAQVVQRFIDAGNAADSEKLKSYLSADSVKLVDNMGAGFEKSLSFAKKSGQAEENQPKIGETTFEGESKAFVKIEPPEGESIPAGINVGLVLVKEEGKWKIDLEETGKRLMEQAMQQMMKEGFKPPPGSAPFGE